MKILHVITGLQKAAGTSVFCAEICNGLAKAGHEVCVAVLSPNANDVYPLSAQVKLIAIDEIFRANSKWDLVHIHALWHPALHKVSNWAHQKKIPVVWSPHGMLTQWALNNKKWKKRLAWRLYQRRDLMRSQAIHVTAEAEIEDVRRMKLTNKIITVPLGMSNIVARVGTNYAGGGYITLRQPVAEEERSALSSCGLGSLGKERNVLYIGRINPIKGLPCLIEAFARTSMKQWKLVIVGPDQEGHRAELEALVAQLGIAESVVFAGPKYGSELEAAYAAADLFVLPSHSENFGSVIVEALAHGLPVITTKGTPWKELEERKCGWWIDIGVEPLAKTLREAMSLPDEERMAMGERGKALVEEKYTWQSACKKMLAGYEEVLKCHF